MPIERIGRTKVEAGSEGSPERLPKFSETFPSDGPGKSGRTVSLGDRTRAYNVDPSPDWSPAKRKQREGCFVHNWKSEPCLIWRDHPSSRP
jgi:hypothetical protein